MALITRMKPDRPIKIQNSSRIKLLEEELTRAIIGAFYEVYNALGFGFLESIYKRAMEIALQERQLIVDREFPVEVFYHGQQIGFHRLDMFVNRRVVVEIKAKHALAYADKLQLMNYLTAMNLEVGLLLHFGPKPEFKRVLGGWRPGLQRSDPASSE
jgi:GxxExxY protein